MIKIKYVVGNEGFRDRVVAYDALHGNADTSREAVLHVSALNSLKSIVSGIKITGFGDSNLISEKTRSLVLNGEDSSGSVVKGVLSVYPNPTKGIVNVRYYSVASGKAVIQIRDVSGKLLMAKSLMLTKGWNLEPFQLGNLNDGIYNISVNEHQAMETLKLIIAR